MNIEAEVEKIKARRRQANAPKPKPLPSGDRGQRFAIWARRNGELLCLGWSELETGGVIGQVVHLHEEWSDMRVVDRDPHGKRGRVLKSETCRKCREQYEAGRDGCSYCNNSFVPAIVGSGPDDVVTKCGYCSNVLESLESEHTCEAGVAVEDVKAEVAQAVVASARGVEGVSRGRLT